MEVFQGLLVLAVFGLLVGGMLAAQGDGCPGLVLIQKEFVPPVAPDFQMKPVGTPATWRK